MLVGELFHRGGPRRAPARSRTNPSRSAASCRSRRGSWQPHRAAIAQPELEDVTDLNRRFDRDRKRRRPWSPRHDRAHVHGLEVEVAAGHGPPRRCASGRFAAGDVAAAVGDDRLVEQDAHAVDADRADEAGGDRSGPRTPRAALGGSPRQGRSAASRRSPCVIAAHQQPVSASRHRRAPPGTPFSSAPAGIPSSVATSWIVVAPGVLHQLRLGQRRRQRHPLAPARSRPRGSPRRSRR